MMSQDEKFRREMVSEKPLDAGEYIEGTRVLRKPYEFTPSILARELFPNSLRQHSGWGYLWESSVRYMLDFPRDAEIKAVFWRAVYWGSSYVGVKTEVMDCRGNILGTVSHH